MSISDELMARYYPLLLGRELAKDAHPLEAKKQLALEIVQTYHSVDTGERTLEEWNARFSEKRLSEAELPEFTAQNGDTIAIVVSAYAEAFGITKSRGDARRLIEQGSVQIDGKKVTDPKTTLSPQAGQVLRLDKTRAVRIK
jgi:tyrosyl-tRNA synthetase